MRDLGSVRPERARLCQAGEIRVVTAEYLATMIFATLRPKDYEDLMYLLGTPGVVDIDRAKALVHRHLGGRFASDQFAAAIEEARWRHERDRA